jgi:hypothetical protein
MGPSQEAQEFYYEVTTAASSRDRWCQIRPQARNRLFKCAMAVWPVTSPDYDDLPISADDLIAETVARYKQIYGNPLVIWIILAIAKALIMMLIEWWLNRQNTRTAILECSAICNAAGVNLDQCFE